MVRRQKPHQVPAKDVSTLPDSDSAETDSFFGSETDEWEMDSAPRKLVQAPMPVSAPPKKEVEDDPVASQFRMMPRSTHEVPLFWRDACDEASPARTDLVQLAQAADPGTGVLRLTEMDPSLGEPAEEPIVNVRLAKVDTTVATEVPRRIETLGLHALADLHQQLEEERLAMPGELVVPGRVCGLAVPMLIDTGASVSLASTALWERLHVQSSGLTLLSTNCCIRTVSGDRACVRGRLVLEVELAGQYYVHQFIVADIAENMILGLDFLRKHQVDCDWGLGVLRLRGVELQTCRQYSMGDGLVRRLTITAPVVVPAYSQVVIEAQLGPGDPGELPEWGVVSTAQKPMNSYGVIIGAALVDPRGASIPVPVINPGSTSVKLPTHTLIGHLIPVERVMPLMDDGNTDLPIQTSRVNQLTQRGSPDPVKKPRSPCFDPEMRDQDEHEWAQYEEAREEYLAKPQTGVPQQLMDSPVDDTDHESTYSQLVEERPRLRPLQAKHWSDVCSDTTTDGELEERAWEDENAEKMEDSDLTQARAEFRGDAPNSRAEPRAETSAHETRAETSTGDGSGTTHPTDCPGAQNAGKIPEKTLVPPHLVKLYEETLVHLENEEDHQVLAEFLVEYQDVFATSSDDLGRSGEVQHRIDTGDCAPIKQQPRRVPLHKKKLVQEEVDKMLKRGVIEPCEGPWASPIVMVTKKDGTPRFCVDFRRLNDVTRKDAYPLPRIEDNLDTLQGAKYYSTLDLLSGFWQVEMAPEDRDKTAFTHGGGGLYRFLTMPFGLCNAPATFQRLMEQVLQGLQWEIAVLYIDDIIVFGDSVKSHLQRLGAVLTRLKAAGLKLKPSKCDLLRKRVPFLGHIVSAGGIEVDPEKIRKVRDWSVPSNLTELRSFVGLCAYYRRFVPNFSTLCKPLFKLTEKGEPFFWGGPQQHAMDKMKELLTTAPILGYPRTGDPFILDCDASNFGLGAVLSQVQDDQEKVIAYASQSLSKAQRNYCTTRRELLAIVTFVKQFHHYLYGGRFLVRTDHAALYWLLRKKDPEGQMARWITFLQAYDLEIQHRPGLRHGNADALSRCLEGCRELDDLAVREGERATLSQLRERATGCTEKIRRVQTRTDTKLKPVEVHPATTTDAPAEGHHGTDDTGPDRQASGGAHRLSDGEDRPHSARDATSAPSAPGVRRNATSQGNDDTPQSKTSRGGQLPTAQNQSTAEFLEELEDIAEAERLEQFYTEQLPETWSEEAMAYLQGQDTDLKLVRTWLESGEKPDWQEVARQNIAVKTWWGRFEQLLLSSNGVIYLAWESSSPKLHIRHRVIAVKSMFKSILKQLHDAPTSGHLGQKKTIGRTKQSPFYWPGMAVYARRWVENCQVCAAKKNPQYSKRTPLQTYWVGSTMDRVSMDLVGPFHPRTPRGHNQILSLTDHATRWVECWPLKDGTATEIAAKVVEFVCRLGMPLELHSDRGRNVDGQVIREVCKILDIRKTHTTAYHPQSNGITERINSTLKSLLTAYVNDQGSDWDLFINPVMMAFRSSIHRSLKETPNAMMLGREVRLPLHSFIPPPPEEEAQSMLTTEYAEALSSALVVAHATAARQLETHYAYQRRMYDRNVRAQTLEVGQPVWLRTFPCIVGRSKSLMRPWDGPWIIVANLGSVNFRIQKTLTSKSQVVNGDRLKKFTGEISSPATLKLWKTFQETSEEQH